MKQLSYTLCRILFGLVFVYASLDKIIHPDLFQEAVMNYRILPAPLTSLTALVLPWMELIFGLALALNIFPRGSGLILNLLMAVFMAALAFNLYRGMDIHCGCFTTDPSAESNMVLSISRDAAIFLAGLWALIGIFRKDRTA